MNKEAKIDSPNNWLVKAGAHAIGNQLIFPIQCLLVPMALASEAIVSYREVTALNDRIKHGLVVVTMIRMADTVYFKRVAKMLMDEQAASKRKYVALCQHCIRGQLWPSKMKKYRQQANKNMIHKMEDGLFVNNTDLEIVELYYEEMFKHPLTNPISWEERTGIESCPKCRKKNMS